MRRLTRELGDILIGLNVSMGPNAFYLGVQDECVRPAMILHEKIISAMHHFYTDINPYMVCNKDGFQTPYEFYREVRSLQCQNVLQNRKKLQFDKMDPKPTPEELFQNLANVLALAPAVHMRQIGSGDSLREPVLVRKQQMLVAWGPPEKRNQFQEKADRTLIHQIFYSKPSTNERSIESWAASWRWGMPNSH